MKSKFFFFSAAGLLLLLFLLYFSGAVRAETLIERAHYKLNLADGKLITINQGSKIVTLTSNHLLEIDGEDLPNLLTL